MRNVAENSNSEVREEKYFFTLKQEKTIVRIRAQITKSTFLKKIKNDLKMQEICECHHCNS